MRFGSVCSGIEAASVAWHPLGWEAAWLSEIEPFPCAVLAHHYPNVPNLGDMTALPDRILSGEVEAPDLFCGGTPCQAFSVAGLRNSLDDARGNLSLTFVGIANAIDHVRVAGGSKPAIIFWENVPGVLSTKDNAFGCFLAGLAGEDDPLEAPGGKWTNAGYVLGPKRAVAWRVLDAQYFGVAQRRRRVFVVASARDDFDPAQVLFEWNSVRRDSAPSREAREEVARRAGAGASFGGMSPVAGTLTANTGGMTRPAGNANELDFCVPVDTFSCGGIGAYTRDTNAATLLKSGQDLGNGCEALIASPVPVGIFQDSEFGVAQYDSAGTLRAGRIPEHQMVMQPMPINTMVALRHEALGEGTGFGIGEAGDPAYTLTKGHSHAVAQPMPVGIFQDSEFGVQKYDSAGTLRAGRIPEHQMVMQPISFHPTQDPISSADGSTHALGCGSSGGQASVAVAVSLRGREGGATAELGDEVQNCLRASQGGGDKPHVLAPVAFQDPVRYGDHQQDTLHHESGVMSSLPAGSNNNGGHYTTTVTAMQVRRLTPVECERLQGFPTVSEKVIIEACLDHQNQSVHVALKCLRWQNSAWPVGVSELMPHAKTAAVPFSTSQANQEPLAALHVRMHSVDELLEIRSAGRLIWSANGAGQSRKSLPPTLTENSVQELARLLRVVARTIMAGKAESPPSIRLSFPASSGAISAEKSGREMEVSASDAMSDQHRATFTTSDLGLITTFSDSTTETLCCFALHAIAGCIPSTTLPETFSIELTVETPYTAIPWRKKPASECPDGPRYKALGNSWAVPNVRWIGKRIQEALNALP